MIKRLKKKAQKKLKDCAISQEKVKEEMIIVLVKEREGNEGGRGLMIMHMLYCQINSEQTIECVRVKQSYY